MHEMGIASSIIDAVRKEAARYPDCHITKVGMRLGEYAGVDTGSLTFCFDALVKGTDLEPVKLEIEDCQQDELELSFVEFED